MTLIQVMPETLNKELIKADIAVSLFILLSMVEACISSGSFTYEATSTFDAWGPLGPSTTSKVTLCPSFSVLKPSD